MKPTKLDEVGAKRLVELAEENERLKEEVGVLKDVIYSYGHYLNPKPNVARIYDISEEVALLRVKIKELEATIWLQKETIESMNESV